MLYHSLKACQVRRRFAQLCMVKLASEEFAQATSEFPCNKLKRNHSIRRGMNPSQLQNMLMQDAIIVQQAIEMSKCSVRHRFCEQIRCFAQQGIN